MTDSKKYTKSERTAQEYVAHDANLQRYLESEQSKATAKTKVTNVVYSNISKWVGREIKEGHPIPTIHKMSFGERPPELFNASIYVANILIASHVYNTREITQRIDALEKIKKHAEEMRKEIAELDAELMVLAKHAARNLHPNIEGRVVTAIGADTAAIMGLEVIAVGVSEQIIQLKAEISKRTKRTGRPRNEAAHKVALEAARLYVKVTGKKPTYSESKDGLSGEYTPFLREVFDAYGWSSVSLRSPAEAAINNLKRGDFSPDITTYLPPV